MKKRLLAVLMGAMLVGSLLVGCTDNGNGGDEPEEVENGEEVEAPRDDEDIRVILITMDSMDQHWVVLEEGAREAAEAAGVDFSWMAPDTKDDAQQIERINNAVADNADVIIIASNGPDTTVPALEEAKAAGVRIIYVDSPANTPAEASFTTNNHQAGVTAGEEMLAALTEQGLTEGDIGVINVNPATISTVEREAGFREAFEGTDFTILETEFTEGEVARSQNAADNFITEGVVGIFGTNEGGSTGVGNAIMASGTDIVGVGFDTSDALLQLVEEGALIAVMAQNPRVMGQMGMEAAIAVMRGETLPETDVDTGVSVITADDL